ncbi:hypothetical protein J6590_044578 [Homalodisca vitripennis]|nr:hypothetical protein J6590_044578 [Homalodisca vitripennis]
MTKKVNIEHKAKDIQSDHCEEQQIQHAVKQASQLQASKSSASKQVICKRSTYHNIKAHMGQHMLHKIIKMTYHMSSILWPFLGQRTRDRIWDKPCETESGTEFLESD